MKREIIGIVAKRIIDHAIGFKGGLPWHIPDDLKHFKSVTMVDKKEPFNNICIMGKNTYLSIPNGHLPGRVIYVVSKTGVDIPLPETTIPFPSAMTALQAAIYNPDSNIFVCGGVGIYRELQNHIDKFIVTNIYDKTTDYPVDVFFPVEILNNFRQISSSGIMGGRYEFTEYVREEMGPDHQYINLVRKIMCHGKERKERTGVGTVGLFGESMKFDLRRGFPILTTKRVFWRGVVEELFWFISGSTDSKLLANRGIKIWEGNTSREFLDNVGLNHLREGDIGAGYGFQWRHWGASYEGCDKNYSEKGIDQLNIVLDKIRNNPGDRRIIVSAWNVSELKNMCLCPCHMFFQYYVDGDFLDMVMYQRSADIFLGVPFNISSYALLLTMTAHLTGKTPRYLTMNFGDVHVYQNHIQQSIQQLNRQPFDLPILRIESRDQKTWEDFTISDIHLMSYVSHEPIKAPMAV